MLLLGASTKNRTLKDRLEGITRLERLVFLIGKETNLPNMLSEDANFRPYDLGLFSDEVYKAVNHLSSYGLIDDTGLISNSRDDSWEQFNIIDMDQVLF